MSNPDRIPLGILAPRKPVQPSTPLVEKSTVPSMTLEYMQSMVTQGLEDIIKNEIEKKKLPYKIENGRIVDALAGTDLHLNRFITVTESCLKMKQDVIKMAKCPNEVLITGETGTGKELIARAMIGERMGGTIAVNCGGLPEHLIESELFGHVRGAFTGAEGDKQGMCQFAKNGILFLDEIGELPLSVQAKFLRAIQDKCVRRVGANKEEEITCKFVCATNRNLKQMVLDKVFKEDLYARISTLEIDIPPLRERPLDIEPIILNEKDGRKFLDALVASGQRIKDIDVSLNVRSIQRCVVRYNVLGRVILS